MVGKIKVYQLDPQTQGKLRRLFNGGRCEFAQFGDIRCIMPSSYKDDADSFRNMVVRADDVWVVTFPRSGTTWMQELVWMVMNNFDYDKSSKIPLMRRYIFLEINNVTKLIPARRQITDPVLLKYIKVNQSYEDIVKAPSPRFIKTHMPLSLLPVNLLDTTKVVYVARDPRDVAVSLLHHHKLIFSCSGEFKTYWNLFIQNLTFRAPYFAHLKEAWALRRHPNMLFIFYEEMIKFSE